MVAIRTIVRTPLPNEERRGSPTDADPPEDWRDEEVTRDEMALIFCRPAKAPPLTGRGPRKGVSLDRRGSERASELFNNCLGQGRFSSVEGEPDSCVKSAGLPPEFPLTYRLIRLLNDAGNILECIIASQIVEY